MLLYHNYNSQLLDKKVSHEQDTLRLKSNKVTRIPSFNCLIIEMDP